MKQYRLWVRITPYQTAHTNITAENDYAAKQLGEAMFGKGNVLNWTRVS